MIYAISYSNEKYDNPKKWNLKSALEWGADKVIGYSPTDIDNEFYNKNKTILDCERGNGYWIWKPYVILKTLMQIEYGDCLIYSDAGVAYVNDINKLIDKMNYNNDDIMVFFAPNIERQYSKRDAFVLMDCDKEEYYNSYQAMATFIVMRKTEQSIQFIKEWLKYCQDERIVTDNKNVMGLDNYPDFIDNRHDQTVLSLLAKKWKLRKYENPSACAWCWLGEEIQYEGKTWMSHHSPYVRDLNELLRTNLKYHERYWQEGKKTIVYGAGERGKEFYSRAKKMKRKIDAFVVSAEKNIKEQSIDEVEVYSMEKFPFEIAECRFVITARYSTEEIKEILERLGAEYIVYQEYDRNLIFDYWKMIQ